MKRDEVRKATFLGNKDLLIIKHTHTHTLYKHPITLPLSLTPSLFILFESCNCVCVCVPERESVCVTGAIKIEKGEKEKIIIAEKKRVSDK